MSLDLPELASVLGAEPTQVFSEMRTTSMSPDDAVAAYTEGVERQRLPEARRPADRCLDLA